MTLACSSTVKVSDFSVGFLSLGSLRQVLVETVTSREQRARGHARGGAARIEALEFGALGREGHFGGARLARIQHRDDGAAELLEILLLQLLGLAQAQDRRYARATCRRVPADTSVWAPLLGLEFLGGDGAFQRAFGLLIGPFAGLEQLAAFHGEGYESVGFRGFGVE